MRNFGVPTGHTHVALNSILAGLNKLEVNRKHLNEDLENNWQVITEAIQTILRREGVPEPYEKLKALSRGKQITKMALHQFILELDVDPPVKQELMELTPYNYIGVAL
jgi:adenylosuccinate lyase